MLRRWVITLNIETKIICIFIYLWAWYLPVSSEICKKNIYYLVTHSYLPIKFFKKILGIPRIALVNSHVKIIFLQQLLLWKHSSKIRKLCLMEFFSKILQTLPYFWGYENDGSFFSFFFQMNILVYIVFLKSNNCADTLNDKLVNCTLYNSINHVWHGNHRIFKSFFFKFIKSLYMIYELCEMPKL